MSKIKKIEFYAVVFSRGRQEIGSHEIVLAENIEMARKILIEKYGGDTRISIYDPKSAERPR